MDKLSIVGFLIGLIGLVGIEIVNSFRCRDFGLASIFGFFILVLLMIFAPMIYNEWKGPTWF